MIHSTENNSKYLQAFDSKYDRIPHAIWLPVLAANVRRSIEPKTSNHFNDKKIYKLDLQEDRIVEKCSLKVKSG